MNQITISNRLVLLSEFRKAVHITEILILYDCKARQNRLVVISSTRSLDIYRRKLSREVKRMTTSFSEHSFPNHWIVVSPSSNLTCSSYQPAARSRSVCRVVPGWVSWISNRYPVSESGVVTSSCKDTSRVVSVSFSTEFATGTPRVSASTCLSNSCNPKIHAGERAISAI